MIFEFWANLKNLYLLAEEELESGQGVKMTGMKRFFKRKKNLAKFLSFDPLFVRMHPAMVWFGVIFWILRTKVHSGRDLLGCVEYQNRAWKGVLGPCGNVRWLVEPIPNFRCGFR